jgi:hypothetical protein
VNTKEAVLRHSLFPKPKWTSFLCWKFH